MIAAMNCLASPISDCPKSCHVLIPPVANYAMLLPTESKPDEAMLTHCCWTAMAFFYSSETSFIAYF